MKVYEVLVYYGMDEYDMKEEKIGVFSNIEKAKKVYLDSRKNDNDFSETSIIEFTIDEPYTEIGLSESSLTEKADEVNIELSKAYKVVVSYGQDEYDMKEEIIGVFSSIEEAKEVYFESKKNDSEYSETEMIEFTIDQKYSERVLNETKENSKANNIVSIEAVEETVSAEKESDVEGFVQTVTDAQRGQDVQPEQK